MEWGGDALGFFIEKLNGINDPAELRSIFAEAVGGLGFRYFAYHLVKIAEVGNRLPYAITTYPEHWISHYISEGYLQEDPVLGEAPNRHVPFAWSEITPPEHLSRKQRQLFDEARDIGVRDGFTIPIHGRNGEFATMSLVPDGSEAQAGEVMTRNRHLLHLMSLYYHSHTCGILIERSMSSPRSKGLLSPREREVLFWTAKGKTNSDIAIILSLSDKGVEFHLDNAKKKLNVFNKTHAVVKAIMLGQITIE
jgi:DNA-binding CsgD family transcriptional regulator